MSQSRLASGASVGNPPLTSECREPLALVIPTGVQTEVKVADACRVFLGPWAYHSHAADLSPRHVSARLSAREGRSRSSQSYNQGRSLSDGPWL